MSLSKEFIFAYILDEMRSDMGEMGFVLSEEKRSFRKEFEDGFQCVFFEVVSRRDQFFIDCLLGIRIERIEDMVNEALGKPLLEYDDSLTLVMSYGQFLGRPKARFSVSSIYHLDEMIHELLRFLYNEGSPFLNDHIELWKIDLVFNSDPQSPCALLNNQAQRCLKGLAAAWLMQSPGFHLLASTYREQLHLIPGGAYVLPGYEELYQMLNAY